MGRSTLIDIADLAEVRKIRAECLIMHWNLLREFHAVGPSRVRSWVVHWLRSQLVAR
jgi:hypothetical protein